MKKQKNSKAFTLIEVIISIIILGIIMSSMSILLNTFTSSIKTANKEEIFFSQFSLLLLVNSTYFDQNNTKTDTSYRVLNTYSSADSELKVHIYPPTEVNRVGKHYISQGKQYYTHLNYRAGSLNTVSRIGPDSGENDSSKYNDIDDYNGYGEHLAGVYKNGYDVNVSVKYIDDKADYKAVNISKKFDYTTNTTGTNIKLITVYTKLKDGSVIKLTYPTCNIGLAPMLSNK